MNAAPNPSPRLPLILSILPTRAEVEDTATADTVPVGGRSPQTSAAGPHQVMDAEIRRAIEESRTRRATGKKPKTYTVEEVRKRLRLPPPPPR